MNSPRTPVQLMNAVNVWYVSFFTQSRTRVYFSNDLAPHSINVKSLYTLKCLHRIIHCWYINFNFFGFQDKSCRVYVGNLSWYVTEEGLKEHMETVGKVAKVQIFKYDDGASKGCGLVTYSQDEEARKAIAELNDSKVSERMIFVREDREETEGVAAYGTGRTYRPRSEGRGARRFSRGNRFRNSRYNGDQAEEDNPVPANSRRGGRGGYNRRGYGREFYGNSRFNNGNPYKLSVTNLNPSTTWKDLKDLFREAGDVTRADVIPSADGERSGIVFFSNLADAQNAIETLDNRDLRGSRIAVSMEADAHDSS
ncbi:Rna recognition motif-containing protein [Cardiosporidium cionae]|uniref:Rna recognition motif-containing protein n=1 Tax=Cardiosporidium cionae TaxID=476202 RepID=A0ABQ7JGK1_9APIC|nr:Rna recognition motif-containing protein [Cardiosporidium cionae]|eukprot:KAF8823083.1 Rna recognition motif-containing protein [Cardiosporidium cionae]